MVFPMLFSQFHFAQMPLNRISKYQLPNIVRTLAAKELKIFSVNKQTQHTIISPSLLIVHYATWWGKGEDYKLFMHANITAGSSQDLVGRSTNLSKACKSSLVTIDLGEKFVIINWACTWKKGNNWFHALKVLFLK